MDSGAAMSRTIALGPFRLDVQAGVLLRDGRPETLGARGVAVLAALVRNAGSHVTRQELLDAAWPGLVVEESNLSVQISAVRRVLAQVSGGDGWIETLARRGYRYVGPHSRIDDASSDAAPAPVAAGLPASTTRFIGRERELIELKHRLADARLVTVIGAGGLGKTRLALQAANEVAGAYRDGVAFVDLARIDDPARVPSAVAQALGVRDTPGRSLLDALTGHLRRRECLLVVDNCEHLLDPAAATIDALLAAAPGLSVVATSREALGLPGEQAYPLAPLALPGGAGDDEDEAYRSEAVQLFLDRARLRRPDYTLADGPSATIVQLCRRLDGIPLALELAAGRLPSLGATQIVARLDDRLRLLTAGSRTALPRQQTLRATLDWSHDMLPEPERALFRRLAVFPGSFALEAAVAVAAGDGQDELGVIELLSRLVARSLVIADFTPQGARYRLLETTRAYALERLAAADEVAAMRRRHATQVATLVARAHDDWLRLPEDRWWSTYAGAPDDLRAALAWVAGEGGDAALAFALAAGSGPLWLELSLAGEGRERLKAAAASLPASASAADRARLHLWLGMLLGDSLPADVLESKTRAVACAREAADAGLLGLSLVQWAYTAAHLGRLDEADAALDEAERVLPADAPARLRARWAENRAFVETRRGRLAEGQSLLEASLAALQAGGHRREVARVLGNLADTRWALGDLAAAAEGFRALVQQAAALRMTEVMRGFALCNLAGVLTEAGELDAALAAAREGAPLMRANGALWIHADHHALRTALAGHLGVAALLAGHADARHAALHGARLANERRARERLQTLLDQGLPADEQARQLAHGARLDDDEALRLALAG